VSAGFIAERSWCQHVMGSQHLSIALISAWVLARNLAKGYPDIGRKAEALVAKLVTIFGGSGFVGRYIARRMAKEGWRVRVAVRRPNEALFVGTYGTVGQVAPILANIRDEESTRQAIQGADAVINCVGILAENSRQRFDGVHHQGAARIARISAEAGVKTLVHLSALGAGGASESNYFRTKAEGEAAVLSAFPSAAIIRPSIIFGCEDQFFNRFAAMTKLSPVLPIVGAETMFQPVFVDDIAKAAVACATDADARGVFELGGPDKETFRILMQRMLTSIRKRRWIVGLPWFVGSTIGLVFDGLQAATLGLFKNGLITRDQVRQLRTDNVVNEGAKGFAYLGIEPTSMEAVLDSYLYSQRPYGQYSAIHESAQN
jgi:uncharacterized protein YbjT (DUF2867 family)